MADQFAIDYRDADVDALLTKFYKATGNLDGNGNRKSYSWHIEFPNINIDQEWETLGALNFCSDNNSVAPGEEGESLPRLVTFLRTGKIGIKNDFPKGELDIHFGDTDQLTRAIFSMQNENPALRLYRDVTGGGPQSHAWWIELHRNSGAPNSSLQFKNNPLVTSPNIGSEVATTLFTMSDNGKFGIKTEDPEVELHVLGKASINYPGSNKIITGAHDDYMLAVEGKIVAKEIIITESNWNSWPDYVFKSNYNLMSLLDVEKSIKQNGHLPGIPSAEDLRDNGINVTEVQAKMLEKIEELTLYMIELKKENDLLKQEINKLK